MKIYKKAILPIDFLASGLACGIKRSGRLDLALFYSLSGARAACQFTTNRILAAPIKLNKKLLKINSSFRAIIVNSGNANCFTHKAGLKDAEGVTASLSAKLQVEQKEILVASTGIIARRLPIIKIKKAIPQLIAGLSKDGVHKAQKAIITTDKFTKGITVKFNIANRTVTVCGVAKGAGMIAPSMATMLVFILTDACIAQTALDKALRICVDNSFNCITVDGCMSTNDSVILLANGSAQNKLIYSGRHFDLFTVALKYVCLELAKMIVRDAEGASKFIQIKVKEAKSFQEARKAALNVANSNLFKTAVYGQNPNFGRIVASLGQAGIDIKEEDLKIKVSPLNKKDIFVEVFMKRGGSSATVYTSDLTPEYIKINAEYN
ncbi:MAG: bifunctional glutamate N-acetyltransferase/amino-acid acetyltransferase ArgJ [Candidatus Omnitrophica bacterium]|nr:bifunctional glutamate N-acetyltransferase/amino-acid acetyltransferase ArgJ [Candidatus Omnitrophota bacterium]MDD5237573.1 bifunctional glutamate N-acetyltransferase/amino-acid acetyltransferase ArgJ [Candidatus Omnitrophota bacterium]